MANRSILAVSILSVAVFFAACVKRPIQLTTPCPAKPVKEVVGTLSALVLAEGMQITLVNDNVGILQAATPEDHSWTGAYSTNQWTFSMKGDTVLAFAKAVQQTRNAFGAMLSSYESYLTDEVHPDYLWYWNVRRGLEALCGEKVVFIQK